MPTYEFVALNFKLNFALNAIDTKSKNNKGLTIIYIFFSLGLVKNLLYKCPEGCTQDYCCLLYTSPLIKKTSPVNYPFPLTDLHQNLKTLSCLLYTSRCV